MIHYAVLVKLHIFYAMMGRALAGREGAGCFNGLALVLKVYIEDAAFFHRLSNKNALLKDGWNDRGDVFFQ